MGHLDQKRAKFYCADVSKRENKRRENFKKKKEKTEEH